MADSKDIKKLRLLLEHWVQHNTEHGDEFRLWGREVEEVSAYLDAAAQHCDEASFMLRQALEQLGGPLEDKSEHRHSLRHRR